MKGAIAGDILGAHYEFQPIRDNDFPLFDEHYYFTDDTVLTIATAEKLLTNDDYVNSYIKWGRKYPNMTWGIRFKNWLFSEEQKPYNSFGNGSAMRVAPIGWYFDTLEETLAEAKRSAEVSHNHPEGIKGAQAIASAIFLARNKTSKKTIKEYLELQFGYNLSKTYAEIHKDYMFNETCQGSVPEAIICFLEFQGFEEIVRNTVALGGDADTQACISGAIAEAYYGGVPDDIWKKCEEILDPELISIINLFNSKKVKLKKNNP